MNNNKNKKECCGDECCSNKNKTDKHNHTCCCEAHDHEHNEFKLASEDIENDFSDVSDDLKQYYSDISLKIISLIKEEKYEDALDIIDDELEQPYVPNSILVSFTRTRKEIEIQLAQSKFDSEIESMTKFEMWNKIYDEKKHKVDIVFLNILLEKFGEEFDELDFAVINKIFKDKKISNLDKSHLLFIIFDFDPDYKFTLYNNFLNKEFSFIPREVVNTVIPRELTIKKLEETFMKDPSKLEISYNLLQLLSSQYIPQEIPFSDDEIAQSITDLVNSFFGDSLNHQNEITDIITKMLQDQE